MSGIHAYQHGLHGPRIKEASLLAIELIELPGILWQYRIPDHSLIALPVPNITFVSEFHAFHMHVSLRPAP